MQNGEKHAFMHYSQNNIINKLTLIISNNYYQPVTFTKTDIIKALKGLKQVHLCHTHMHRRMRWGTWGHVPPPQKKSGKIFFGQLLCLKNDIFQAENI